jgi:hypothetical protein
MIIMSTKKKSTVNRAKPVKGKLTRHARGFDKTAKIVPSNLPDHLKISTALMIMMRHETEDFTRLSEYRELLDIIVYAWNTSIVCETTETQATLESIYKELEKESSEGKKMFEYFIKKKARLLPNDKRIVTMWDVRKEDGYVFVSAAVSIDEDTPPLPG